VPAPGLVAAVDIGTTGVKAAAVDAAAASHAAAEREYPTASPRPGWAVQDPDVVAGCSAAAVGEALAKVGAAGKPVAGVAFSGAMHSLLALAADGTPLTPSVTWADGRAGAQAERLRVSGEWLALHRRTGTPVHPMSPLVKLLWFREQAPDVWQRAAHWVGIKDYVLFRLTGLLAVDESTASATGLYGLAARDWDAKALDLVGLGREQLPVLHATTDVVARLGADAATWGLPAGTPIVAGASDGVLANLGVGGVAPGVAACSIGTSAAIRGAVRAPSVDEQGRVFCYALVPGRWVIGGATNNGGNVLRWLDRVAGADLADPDAALTELAATVPPGAEGLLMLPYLSGERAPRWAGAPQGAFLGLTRRHTRAHLVRAALEGVCLQLALVLEAMRAAGWSWPSCGPREDSPGARSGASSWPTSWGRRSGSRPASRDRPWGPPCSATSPSGTSGQSTTPPRWSVSPRWSTRTMTRPGSTAGCCRRSPRPRRRWRAWTPGGSTGRRMT
jgi:gluconokinase